MGQSRHQGALATKDEAFTRQVTMDTNTTQLLETLGPLCHIDVSLLTP